MALSNNVNQNLSQKIFGNMFKDPPLLLDREITSVRLLPV
jgi:hypothetical protein